MSKGKDISRFKIKRLDSSVCFPGGRDIRIYLPPDYYESSRGYPVLYMFDGQNLFDEETSFSGSWKAGEAADSLFYGGEIGGIIIVGIDNGGINRLREYLPWTTGRLAGLFPGGESAESEVFGKETLALITGAVKTYVDSGFRTVPDRFHTGIAGSSLGGLMAFYSVMTRPDVFGAAGIFSPYFWPVREQAAFTAEKAVFGSESLVRLYMDVGTGEKISSSATAPEIYADIAGEISGLLARKKNVEHRFLIERGGLHNEAAWAGRFPAALEWLFGGI